MGLVRRNDWPARLLDAISEKATMRFSPGTHDCCISACDIIERMTGTDIAAGFRGYTNKDEMLKVWETHGGVEAIVQRVMAENDCAEIPISLASRGDMIMLETPDGPTLAIVDTDGINVVACGVRGLERVCIKDNAARAWRIG